MLKAGNKSIQQPGAADSYQSIMVAREAICKEIILSTSESAE
jgi:hypothetical protein